MKIKVCGLSDLTSIRNIDQLNIEYAGFIFYPKSLRCLKLDNDTESAIKNLNTQKIAVFVNESLDHILNIVDRLNIDMVQLHGEESPDFCKAVQKEAKIIKVFKVDKHFDFEDCKAYAFANYFLFDTLGRYPGGNGLKFNWNLMDNYRLDVPFLLSGGIHFEDAEGLRLFRHPQFEAIDINSGFEYEPGQKNINLIKAFKDELSDR